VAFSYSVFDNFTTQWVRKVVVRRKTTTRLFAMMPFYTKSKSSFYQDGLGTNIRESTQNKDGRFLRKQRPACSMCLYTTPVSAQLAVYVYYILLLYIYTRWSIYATLESWPLCCTWLAL
jgi:hypothetical protein